MNYILEIPESFKTAVKKMHPEIEDISFFDYEVTKMYNPNTFLPTEGLFFYVKVKVHIKRDIRPKGVKDYYKEVLNQIFQYTFGEKNISMIVEELIVPHDKTDEEMFFEIFKPVLP